MRSDNTFEPTGRKATVKPFAVQTKAVDPTIHLRMAAIFVLALLTMIAAGVMSMHPSSASQAENLANPPAQGLATTKSDRIASAPSTNTCASQAWGAWSDDCAAVLGGANKVRTVSFVTVEKAAPSVNETILARYPTAR
ncbi:phosphopantetheine adenylyltransferase [Roseibium salinum]|uniref:Phosphopantetheine adenylyltransferase n=1 Tax=Roseibium salinum TaxID=1604349 RepID=A0ABT3R0J5_9HYPH|nr:phosphopantetheine adenylyltransferase [Roseibium sp. DSM 29163]MCX2722733.1 phosphopantetheine adenylyltransferase [Roseibium sp. DSM 29163]MDN3719328.1 phosphopantetheine adenylyltransferase [Roseibium salinum]